jgi:hypothetical protein
MPSNLLSKYLEYSNHTELLKIIKVNLINSEDYILKLTWNILIYLNYYTVLKIFLKSSLKSFYFSMTLLYLLSKKNHEENNEIIVNRH